MKLKDKVFKTITRPAMTYGSECWAVKKKDENKLNSAEMRKTRLDHIRNEDIRKDADVKPVETFQQKTKVVWPLLEARTQLHLCEIAKTRGFWEKKQRAEDDRKRDGRTTCRET